MAEPPLRHWWLLALGKTVKYLLDYEAQSNEAYSATLGIRTPPPPPPPPPSPPPPPGA